jgi:septal ring-binding cell division protein DamX
VEQQTGAVPRAVGNYFAAIVVNNKNKHMKKSILALSVVVVLASCGSNSNNSTEESTSDSANRNMANQSPAGDTANQLNNRGGMYQSDSSNKSGDDSVSGSNPASRTSTPGNESGQGGDKE